MARTVELYIDGAWVDVTSAPGYVLADAPITITRGVDSQSNQPSPGSCSLTLYDRNRDGRWSNRVPTSTNWGKLGRNTPIRVSVDGDVRFVGEVPRWEPRWEVGDRKVRVPVEAAGVLRRLTQGGRRLQSPAYRAIMADANTVAYWPIEEQSGATSIMSPMAGVASAAYTGTVNFGGYTDAPSTPRMAAFGASGLIFATVPAYTATRWKVIGLFTFPDAGTLAADSALLRIYLTGSTLSFIDLLYGTGGDLKLRAYAGGAVVSTIAYVGFGVDGQHCLVDVDLAQNGANIDAVVFKIATGENGSLGSSSFAGQTLGTCGFVTVGQTNISGVSFGQLMVGTTFDFATNFVNPLSTGGRGVEGYAGEPAGRRAERLCDEEGVTFASVGNLDATELMGPQTADTLVANLEACARADQGRLYETRGELGLTYRTRVSLYNQYGPLVDYSAGHIAPSLEPSEDDTFIHNDVTVSRDDGSSARSVLDEATDLYHTLTTQAPPDGVGTYDRGAVTVSVETDDQLQPLADWLRHLGTWDELRYPSLTVELAAGVWDSNATLAADLAELDTGGQLRLDGLPAWLPPDQVALLVQGSVEVIGTHTRSITWNLIPGWPWEVWELDSGGSNLAVAVNSAATSLKIGSYSGPEWSTTAEPYHIIIDGEAMTVTAMTTDTPAFIAAGTVAHANNASVTPGLPAGITPDVGQLLLIWCAIRNSGTGTPNTPTGWTKLVDCSNAALFGKYYVTGDTAPAISFTGGVANADTSARMFAFSGLSYEIDGGKYSAAVAGAQTQLNSSAQNIAYPALTVRRNNCVVLFLGWKQDDWTSVATVGDAEIIDNATTTGDDQGIVADYDIQTTATDIAAGSFTVTGGASAISRAAVVAFRPLQTATVTRAVNGVSKSIAAGKLVHGWRMGVVAL